MNAIDEVQSGTPPKKRRIVASEISSPGKVSVSSPRKLENVNLRNVGYFNGSMHMKEGSTNLNRERETEVLSRWMETVDLGAADQAEVDKYVESMLRISEEVGVRRALRIVIPILAAQCDRPSSINEVPKNFSGAGMRQWRIVYAARAFYEVLFKACRASVETNDLLREILEVISLERAPKTLSETRPDRGQEVLLHTLYDFALSCSSPANGEKMMHLLISRCRGVHQKDLHQYLLMRKNSPPTTKDSLRTACSPVQIHEALCQFYILNGEQQKAAAELVLAHGLGRRRRRRKKKLEACEASFKSGRGLSGRFPV